MCCHCDAERQVSLDPLRNAMKGLPGVPFLHSGVRHTREDLPGPEPWCITPGFALRPILVYNTAWFGAVSMEYVSLWEAGQRLTPRGN
jgi:hypothetical protein